MHVLNGKLPAHAPVAHDGCACNGNGSSSMIGNQNLWILMAIAFAIGAIVKK